MKPRAPKSRPTVSILTPVRNQLMAPTAPPCIRNAFSLHQAYSYSANQLSVQEAGLTSPLSASVCTVWRAPILLPSARLRAALSLRRAISPQPYPPRPHALPNHGAPGDRVCALVRVCAVVGPNDHAQSAAAAAAHLLLWRRAIGAQTIAAAAVVGLLRHIVQCAVAQAVRCGKIRV